MASLKEINMYIAKCRRKTADRRVASVPIFHDRRYCKDRRTEQLTVALNRRELPDRRTKSVSIFHDNQRSFPWHRRKRVFVGIGTDGPIRTGAYRPTLERRDNSITRRAQDVSFPAPGQQNCKDTERRTGPRRELVHRRDAYRKNRSGWGDRVRDDCDDKSIEVNGRHVIVDTSLWKLIGTDAQVYGWVERA